MKRVVGPTEAVSACSRRRSFITFPLCEYPQCPGDGYSLLGLASRKRFGAPRNGDHLGKNNFRVADHPDGMITSPHSPIRPSEPTCHCSLKRKVGASLVITSFIIHYVGWQAARGFRTPRASGFRPRRRAVHPHRRLGPTSGLATMQPHAYRRR